MADIFLVTGDEIEARVLERFLHELGARGRVVPILTRDALRAHEAEIAGDALLLSFSSNLIVPARILDALARPAYNFHPASPDYPGREPHHFAVYEGARRYGATAHEMAAKVDSGAIVDVELFDVPPGAGHERLFEMAYEAMVTLFARLVPRLLEGERPEPLGLSWGPRKTTRRDFEALCRITPEMGAEEFARRFHAVDGGAEDNLWVELHGHRFRIEKPRDPAAKTQAELRLEIARALGIEVTAKADGGG